MLPQTGRTRLALVALVAACALVGLSESQSSASPLAQAGALPACGTTDGVETVSGGGVRATVDLGDGLSFEVVSVGRQPVIYDELLVAKEEFTNVMGRRVSDAIESVRFDDEIDEAWEAYLTDAITNDTYTCLSPDVHPDYLSTEELEAATAAACLEFAFERHGIPTCPAWNHEGCVEEEDLVDMAIETVQAVTPPPPRIRVEPFTENLVEIIAATSDITATQARAAVEVALQGRTGAIPSNELPAFIERLQQALPSNALPSSYAADVVLEAIPSNAIPSNLLLEIMTGAMEDALPSNVLTAALPSNALPSSALPSSAIPSNLYEDLAVEALGNLYLEAIPSDINALDFADQVAESLWRAIPSNAIPSNGIPSNVISRSDVHAAVAAALGIPVSDLASTAIPSNAIPSNISLKVAAELLAAIPANALPSNAIPSNALPAGALPSSLVSLINGAAWRALPSNAIPANIVSSADLAVGLVDVFDRRGLLQSDVRFDGEVVTNRSLLVDLGNTALPAMFDATLADDIVVRSDLIQTSFDPSEVVTRLDVVTRSDLVAAGDIAALYDPFFIVGASGIVDVGEATPIDLRFDVADTTLLASAEFPDFADAAFGALPSSASLLDPAAVTSVQIGSRAVILAMGPGDVQCAYASCGACLHASMVQTQPQTVQTPAANRSLYETPHGVFIIVGDVEQASQRAAISPFRELMGRPAVMPTAATVPDPWDMVRYGHVDESGFTGWDFHPLAGSNGYVMESMGYVYQVEIFIHDYERFIDCYLSSEPWRLRALRSLGFTVSESECQSTVCARTVPGQPCWGMVKVETSCDGVTDLGEIVDRTRRAARGFAGLFESLGRSAADFWGLLTDGGTGQDLVEVPRLYGEGLTLEDAASVLLDHGFTRCWAPPCEGRDHWLLVTASPVDDPAFDGIVIAQHPEPGVYARPDGDAIVRVWIGDYTGGGVTTTTTTTTTSGSTTTAACSYRGPVTLKNYAGWTYSSASSDLGCLGLTASYQAGWVATLDSGQVGTVESQEPAAGTTVATGSTVQLWVFEAAANETECGWISGHWRDGGCWSTP